MSRNEGPSTVDDVASNIRQSCSYRVVHFVGAGHRGVRGRRVARDGLRRDDAGGVSRCPQRTRAGRSGRPVQVDSNKTCVDSAQGSSA